MADTWKTPLVGKTAEFFGTFAEDKVRSLIRGKSKEEIRKALLSNPQSVEYLKVLQALPDDVVRLGSAAIATVIKSGYSLWNNGRPMSRQMADAIDGILSGLTEAINEAEVYAGGGTGSGTSAAAGTTTTGGAMEDQTQKLLRELAKDENQGARIVYRIFTRSLATYQQADEKLARALRNVEAGYQLTILTDIAEQVSQGDRSLVDITTDAAGNVTATMNEKKVALAVRADLLNLAASAGEGNVGVGIEFKDALRGVIGDLRKNPGMWISVVIGFWVIVGGFSLLMLYLYKRQVFDLLKLVFFESVDWWPLFVKVGEVVWLPIILTIVGALVSQVLLVVFGDKISDTKRRYLIAIPAYPIISLAVIGMTGALFVFLKVGVGARLLLLSSFVFGTFSIWYPWLSNDAEATKASLKKRFKNFSLAATILGVVGGIVVLHQGLSSLSVSYAGFWSRLPAINIPRPYGGSAAEAAVWVLGLVVLGLAGVLVSRALAPKKDRDPTKVYIATRFVGWGLVALAVLFLVGHGAAKISGGYSWVERRFAAWADPEDEQPECVDKIDNDSDGFVDKTDDGCSWLFPSPKPPAPPPSSKGSAGAGSNLNAGQKRAILDALKDDPYNN